ncbi:hypothetical protein F5X68DRAFT_207500 [Plectosphaerella plurivora]|uniref:C2H2-type domain-containing protein n=1 Tax=Plectosphaerella plurivora TaxID=936078 RepID=A0A9P8VBS4_9PEZI|nr:hypothetical protein F5X68DRAFT_207500 [Plectosphaerella plurivora]
MPRSNGCDGSARSEGLASFLVGLFLLVLPCSPCRQQLDTASRRTAHRSTRRHAHAMPGHAALGALGCEEWRAIHCLPRQRRTSLARMQLVQPHHPWRA